MNSIFSTSIFSYHLPNFRFQLMNVFSGIITQLTQNLAHNVALRSAGLAGLTIAMFSSPALADSNASARGSVTYVTPGGYSTSISAEKVAPSGYTFDSNVTITITPGGEKGAPLGMVLGTGALTAISTTPLSTARLKDAVITKLSGITTLDQAGIDAYSAILKAAAGADGLE
jgi:hypothetical protein